MAEHGVRTVTDQGRMTMSEAATVVASPDGHVLADLIDGWCGHVGRFVRELPEKWTNRSVDLWGIDDLAAAYYLRDRIDAAIPERYGRPPHALELADQILLSFTSASAFDWPRRVGHGGGVEWWWRQLPNRGPVAEQIKSWDE